MKYESLKREAKITGPIAIFGAIMVALMSGYFLP